jgi:hypothetical protein
MKKNFPDNAFETKWICCNEKEIHFDLPSPCAALMN